MQNQTFRQTVTAGALLLLLAAVLWHFGAFWAGVRALLHALRPLLLGLLFATMLHPYYQRLRTDFSGYVRRRGGDPDARWITALSLTGAMLPPVLVLASLVCVLMPQLMQSVQLLSDHLADYSQNLAALQSRTGWLAGLLRQWLSAVQTRLPELLRMTYDCTAAALGVLADILLGGVFSLYLLADKRRLRAQQEWLLRRLLPAEAVPGLMERLRQTCGMFGAFLGSQCRESVILGGLCWLAMALLGFPYPVLISVIIGVTNIVPYFGPLAGTVPSVLLLLLVRPRAVPGFLVMIIALQQVESNLIYPRVVGDSIGLPPAWVLASITLGGGLFGVTGMLLAVPAAAVLYAAAFGGQR